MPTETRSSRRYAGTSSAQCCNMAFTTDGGDEGFYTIESITQQLANIIVASTLTAGFALTGLSAVKIADVAESQRGMLTSFSVCAAISVCVCLLATLLAIFIIWALHSHRVHPDDQALVERVTRTYHAPTVVVVLIFALGLLFFLVSMALLVALFHTSTAALVAAVAGAVTLLASCFGFFCIYCYLRPVDDAAFAESSLRWHDRWDDEFESKWLPQPKRRYHHDEDEEGAPSAAAAAGAVEMHETEATPASDEHKDD